MSFVVWRDFDVDRVRYYLGIPLTKTAYVAQRMAAAEALSQDAVRRVRLLLDELDAADREINAARPFAGQRFANGVTWFQNQRLEAIKSEARRLARNIASVLSLEVENDIWADVNTNVNGSFKNFVSRS